MCCLFEWELKIHVETFFKYFSVFLHPTEENCGLVSTQGYPQVNIWSSDDKYEKIIEKITHIVRKASNLCHNFDAFLTIWPIFQLFPQYYFCHVGCHVVSSQRNLGSNTFIQIQILCISFIQIQICWQIQKSIWTQVCKEAKACCRRAQNMLKEMII